MPGSELSELPDDSDEVDVSESEETAALEGIGLIAESFAAMSFHAGPLPSPETLAGYEDILPGAADRIFTMAETQSTHRHRLETVVIQSDSARATQALWIAGAVAIAGLAVVGVTAAAGQPWIAGMTGGGIITGLVGTFGTFIYGSRSRRSERKEKSEARAPDLR